MQEGGSSSCWLLFGSLLTVGFIFVKRVCFCVDASLLSSHGHQCHHRHQSQPLHMRWPGCVVTCAQQLVAVVVVVLVAALHKTCHLQLHLGSIVSKIQYSSTPTHTQLHKYSINNTQTLPTHTGVDFWSIWLLGSVISWSTKKWCEKMWAEKRFSASSKCCRVHCSSVDFSHTTSGAWDRESTRKYCSFGWRTSMSQFTIVLQHT